MTAYDTDALLRETLQAHQDDVSPGPDPWPRIRAAHRRSQATRRSAATLAIAATVAAATLISQQPWARTGRISQPATRPPHYSADDWKLLDDGRPRGALGKDPALRATVVAALRKPWAAGDEDRLTDPDTVHVIFADKIAADTIGGQHLALVRAQLTGSNPQNSEDIEAWLDGPADGGPMSVTDEWSARDNDPVGLHRLAISSVAYTDSGSHLHMLAVTRRGSTAAISRAVIATDGRVSRNWQPVNVSPDGVIDVLLPDLISLGPLTLRTELHGNDPVYQGSSALTWSVATDQTPPEFGASPDLVIAPDAQTMIPDITAALVGARGHTPWPNQDLAASISTLEQALGNDSSHLKPHVEWAGAVPASRGGGAVTVVTGGLPGQGRILTAHGYDRHGQAAWRWSTSVPAIGLPNLAWRTAVPIGADRAAGHLVGWLFNRDVTAVTVTVDGVRKAVPTDDGLGWLEVRPDQDVTVIGTGPTTEPVTLRLRPSDVTPDQQPGAGYLALLPGETVPGETDLDRIRP